MPINVTALTEADIPGAVKAIQYVWGDPIAPSESLLHLMRPATGSWPVGCALVANSDLFQGKHLQTTHTTIGCLIKRTYVGGLSRGAFGFAQHQAPAVRRETRLGLSVCSQMFPDVLCQASNPVSRRGSLADLEILGRVMQQAATRLQQKQENEYTCYSRLITISLAAEQSSSMAGFACSASLRSTHFDK